MSRPGGVPDPDEEFSLRGCDPEEVFEYADGPGGLDPEQERKMREHLASCPGCRELYERELDLNAFLSTFDLSGTRSAVSRSVALALPTRAGGTRILWGLLASALLVVVCLSSGFGGTEPVILAMNALGACWDLVASSADVARVFFITASSTILLVLALGALADLLIACAVLLASRYRRRAREA